MKDCTNSQERFRRCQERPQPFRAAQQREPFQIVTSAGVSTGEAGDYLVEDEAGRFIVKRAIFEVRYMWTEAEPAPPVAPNQFWDGTKWISGQLAPPVAAVPDQRGRYIGGNYIPDQATLDLLRNQGRHAPVMAAPSPGNFQPSPQLPSVPIPNVPGYAAPAGAVYAGGPNIQVPVAPDGSRPMTAQEMALVAASRAAPGGAVQVPAQFPQSATMLAPQEIAPVPPAGAPIPLPVDPVAAQIAAARAAAQSGKL